MVVIDVMRAYTTLAYAFDRGAREAILVETIEEAFAYRERDPDVLLVGEVGGRPIPGFDLGNSPESLADVDLEGRTIVFRSSNGVRGAVHATQADRIVLASLVVAGATVAWLKAEQPDLVTICAMASMHGKDGVEDDACGDLLQARLEDRDIDLDTIVRRVRESGGGRAALDPAQDHVTPGDLEHASRIDHFPFAMVVEREDAGLIARPVRV
ncbi:MAG: 2-phosphosulfolactate phosphatase [Planctomycetota bacterium]|nr:2-phosphosulfolactate phosphatase [Planctomycetota bacterium]